MHEADRMLALHEAEHPEELSEGEDLHPAIVGIEGLRDAPFAQLLAEVYEVARSGTAAEYPVPPERFASVLDLYGIEGETLSLLAELRRIDAVWRSEAAEVRRQQLEEAKAGREG